MKRRLFPILSALSLLLFAAVVALWVRSYLTEVCSGSKPTPFVLKPSRRNSRAHPHHSPAAIGADGITSSWSSSPCRPRAA